MAEDFSDMMIRRVNPDIEKLKVSVSVSAETVARLEERLAQLEETCKNLSLEKEHPLFTVTYGGTVTLPDVHYTFDTQGREVIPKDGGGLTVDGIVEIQDIHYFNSEGCVIAQLSPNAHPSIKMILAGNPHGFKVMLESLSRPCDARSIGRVSIAEPHSGNCLTYTMQPEGFITDILISRPDGSWESPFSPHQRITKELLGICKETSLSFLPTTERSLFISAWKTWR